MKSSVAVKAKLIFKELRFPTLLSNQISVLQLCLISCETVAVKSFLLVITELSRTIHKQVLLITAIIVR